MSKLINIKIKNDLMLMLVPIFWALTFPFIHVSVKFIAPEAFVFWRFILAAFFLLPFIINVYIVTGGIFILGSVILSEYLNFSQKTSVSVD